ncbi:hypothetical protein SISNIDRAFT_491325 [Sistotremastrum niveocremeum HHB9708]|uniref:F-box domain-containing protein n=2 Tax=Sistotremastraceae TaxID=3402574 RepID=A0A164MWC8_9AGAM|nr:hypothetical protein SISNIDRAFT_491325 [Sistotremastrum niveocremeum HHB9708]KZT32298.1 hypothetical protein SISSUDRAFT_1067045 [Sistotremastrum suecicum HHB10207 ss-3]
MALPIDLYRSIVELIADSTSTLIALATVSRAFQSEAERVLWKSLSFPLYREDETYITNASLIDPLTTLRTRTAKYVRRLMLLGPRRGDRQPRSNILRDEIIHTVSRMKNLEEFLIESAHGLGTQLAQITFPSLRHLIVHAPLDNSLVDFIIRNRSIRLLDMSETIPSDGLSINDAASPARTRALQALSIRADVVESLLWHLSSVDLTIVFTILDNRDFSALQTEAKSPLPVQILRIIGLRDIEYIEALERLAPILPSIKDLSGATTSETTIERFLALMTHFPQMTKLHLVYEGVMWDEKFRNITSSLVTSCSCLEVCHIWAWSEAYHEKWTASRAGPDYDFEIRQAVEWDRDPQPSPASVWPSS